VSALLCGLLAAAGVHLLWPATRTRRWPRPAWRAVAAPLGAALAGAVAGLVVLGGPAAVAVGAIAAGCTVLGRRSVGVARRQQSRRAWPGLLEEVRVLTESGGRSIPRALFEAGARVPEPMASAFRSAQRTWRVSGDFERTLRVLKGELGDASTDLVAETLLVAHEVGGAGTGRRLARLAEDRRRDLTARDLAAAKLAGARFARRFVLIVPVGMAAAGQAVGTGRAAFATPGAQLVGVAAAAMVAACWLWAGHLLRLPDEPRVFA
jgi:tight adherence protein B